jgi:DNA-binding response OmpR family regulator
MNIETLNARTSDPDLPTILIVDDNLDDLEMFDTGFRLYHAPFNAHYCMTGAGAEALVRSQCFDAIAIDVDLPDGLTGTAAGLKIRLLDPGLPILIHTGFSEDVVKPFLEIMRADYLRKGSVTLPELINKLAALARAHRCRAKAKATAGAQNLSDLEWSPAMRERLEARSMAYGVSLRG